MTKIVELIYTTERVGLGQTKEDPVRLKQQLWTKDGQLICESDLYGENIVNIDNNTFRN